MDRIEYIVKSKGPEMVKLSQFDQGDTFKFQHSPNVYYVVRPSFGCPSTVSIAKVGYRRPEAAVEYTSIAKVIPVSVTKVEAEEDWNWTPREGYW